MPSGILISSLAKIRVFSGRKLKNNHASSQGERRNTRNDESTKGKKNEKDQSTNKCIAPKFNVRGFGNLSLGFDSTFGFSI